MKKMKTDNIDTRKEMERLLARFMDGLTSPDEEERIAQYMRRNDVPEEWSAYKEMFAYFDEGMPQGRYDEPQPRRHPRRTALWAGLAVAASVAALLMVTLPRQAAMQPAATPMAAAAPTDSTGTRSCDAENDSLNTHGENEVKPRNRSYYKYKYQPAPPKSYYAKADATTTEGMTAHEDSTAVMAENTISAEADRIVAEQLRLMEQQQQLMMLKAEADIKMLEMQTMMSASADTDGDEDVN